MQNTPLIKPLDKGTYYICTCGASKNFPFCDGTHKTFETQATPTPLTLEDAKPVAFCTCKNSKNGIFCDGSHAFLKPKE